MKKAEPLMKKAVDEEGGSDLHFLGVDFFGVEGLTWLRSGVPSSVTGAPRACHAVCL